MTGREVGISWRGRPCIAWVPDPLAARDLSTDLATVRRTEQAAAAVRRADDRLPTQWEPLARLLLRAEGIASSRIEGIRARVADVAIAEWEPDDSSPATWVADNLAGVQAALTHRGRLTEATLHDWHARVLRHAAADTPALVGRFRTEQAWIGGSSPLDAAYVPPPPGDVRPLVRDLLAFVNRRDDDIVAQAAVVHAQFELIHPYGDGNGRLGRLLMLWLLSSRLDVQVPPPVSAFIAQERGAYLAGLTQFRLGDVNAWVSWLAQVVLRSAEATSGLVDRVADLSDEWRRRTQGLRSDASAVTVLDLLIRQPVVSAGLIARELGISERAAGNAIATLADLGIVVRVADRVAARGRPRAWWMARELVDLVTSWPR